LLRTLRFYNNIF